METTSALITIAELLLFLSCGSGQDDTSLAPFLRPVHLLLHTGPLAHNPQCYSSPPFDPLPIWQLAPCDYLVFGEHEGGYWCEDSSGVRSNTHYWRKKGSPVPEQIVHSVTDLLNSTLIAPTNGFEGIKVPFSKGRKQISGEVEMNGASVTNCSALNLTGNTMFLTEPNTTCPAEREKDEHGVEYYWPPINVGSTHTYSDENMCVQAARTCSWSQERGLHLTPSEAFAPCPFTNINLNTLAQNLLNISKKENISRTDVETAVAIVDEALQVNHAVLSNVRPLVGSVVQALDAVLTQVHLSPGENVTNVGAKVAIFVLNVEKQQPLALALESSSSNEGLEGSILRTINSEEEIHSPEVDVAVRLPELLMTSISHISLAIFSDERAFQDPKYKANSRIVSLNIVDGPELQGEQFVEIVFRSRTENDGITCAFWNFTLNEGAWSAEGCQLIPWVTDTHVLCRCSHLTHFAQIITRPDSTLDPVHQSILSIISIIGCSLSLVGLLAIFITGAAFKQWRAQLGNKILLHLSTAVFINMLVFLITATELLLTGVPCIILGVMLHYSILASFCWMLVSALLQLKRLVIIFGFQYIPRLLLKASLFAWGVPLLPVTVLLAMDVNNYTPEGRSFCYPDGLGFYLAVLCPVLMIVTANLLVFGVILHSVIKGSAIKSHRQNGRKLVMQRIVTSVLLFFLLGLSWVFGLVAHLSIVFAYLFCITATLQGFVLFIFFVLGKKQTRSYWMKGTTERNLTTSTTNTPSERGPLRWRSETTDL